MARLLGKVRRILANAKSLGALFVAGTVAPRLQNGDAAPEPTVERLSRLSKWCVTGQLAAAEVELHEWQRDESCPPAAHALLASLLTRRGEAGHARTVLHTGRSRHENDAQLLQMLICNLTAADLVDAAACFSPRLHDTHGHEPGVASWLQLMQAPVAGETQEVPDALIHQLAEELGAKPEIIPSLVVAQRFAPVATDISLLRQAISRMARHASDNAQQMLVICHAMAELALLANDAGDARRWAHRGLRLNAYSATLALALAQVNDDPAFGRRASEVLYEAIAAHPNYPDLRAALIRRERADGRNEVAKLHLKDWLKSQPDHPLARTLERELAA